MLFLTEIFLRIFISMPSTQQFDSELGYTNIPESKMIESTEGYSHVTFNSLGFNDDEPVKDINNKIFVIGDSYTEAFQVDRAHNYVSLMDKVLNSNNLDAIKLARDSFVPLHYPIVSDRYNLKYKPALTIVQLGFHTLSDLYSENFSISYGENNEISSFSINVSDNDKNKESIRGIINNSALAYYLLRKYKYLILDLMSTFREIKNIFKNRNIEKNVPRSKSIRNHVQRLTYILKNISSPLVVVYFPDPAINLGKNESNDKVRVKIKSACKLAGVKFIDLTDDFKINFSKTNRMLNGFINSKPGEGHLNKDGHQFVAEKILFNLNKMRLINTK